MKSIGEKIRIFQVDTFTNKRFHGNPAAVCILEKPIKDELMQSIALEMNLSETAFLLLSDKNIAGNSNVFSLRWFTPKFEVSLCGHATLATAAVLFDEYNIKHKRIIFKTKSGELVTKKDKNMIILDFPSDEYIVEDIKFRENILNAIGISKFNNIILGKSTKKLVIHLESYEDVLKLNPNFEIMKKLKLNKIKGLGVTAKMDGKYDIISRYFNPWAGVNEDPVTGSVHTLLARYWSNILNKKELKAYQASKRSGEMILKLRENSRVEILGKFVFSLKGEIFF